MPTTKKATKKSAAPKTKETMANKADVLHTLGIVAQHTRDPFPTWEAMEAALHEGHSKRYGSETLKKKCRAIANRAKKEGHIQGRWELPRSNSQAFISKEEFGSAFA